MREEKSMTTSSDERDRLVKMFAYEFVAFNHDPSRAYLVTDITDDCMIELEGMSGLFAPELFKRVTPVRDICKRCNGSGFETDSKTPCIQCCGEGVAPFTPQPAPDAEGEWWVVPEPIHGHRIVDVTGRAVVGNIYREEDAARIVSDHRAVPLLVEALKGLRRVNHVCWCQTWTGGEHEPECLAACNAILTAGGKL